MLIEVEDVLTSDDGLFEHRVNSLALIVFDKDTGKHIGRVERLKRCVEIVVHIFFDLHFYNWTLRFLYFPNVSWHMLRHQSHRFSATFCNITSISFLNVGHFRCITATDALALATTSICLSFIDRWVDKGTFFLVNSCLFTCFISWILIIIIFVLSNLLQTSRTSKVESSIIKLNRLTWS